LLVFSACFAPHAKAQYNNAIGVRATGWSYGITFKHMLSESDGLEFIAFSRWKGFNLTALYEKHWDVITDGMRVYVGGGVHVGSFDGRYSPWFSDFNNHFILGIDGIAGLEYNFEEIPLNISLDYKPALNFVGHLGFWGDEGGLAVRFTF
jgi:hypothetical protein